MGFEDQLESEMEGNKLLGLLFKCIYEMRERGVEGEYYCQKVSKRLCEDLLILGDGKSGGKQM